MYVLNVSEEDAATGNDWTKKAEAMAKAQGAEAVIITASIESEIAQLGSEEEKKEFLSTLGLEEPGLNKIIRAGYQLLGLQTYFTVGPKEARAWTVRKAAKAPEAAGAIHTDFERGFIRALSLFYCFIRAEVISSLWAANKPPKTPEKCAKRARNTPFKMVILCCSGLTSKSLRSFQGISQGLITL